jgi:hypothetical protein
LPGIWGEDIEKLQQCFAFGLGKNSLVNHGDKPSIGCFVLMGL